jgi:hypothetical protein
MRPFRGIGLGRCLQDAFDQRLEFVLNREGLCEVVHGSSLHGFTGRVYRGKSGDDDVDGALLEQRETLLGVTRRQDLVSFRAEASIEEAGDTGFVVDDEDLTQFWLPPEKHGISASHGVVRASGVIRRGNFRQDGLMRLCADDES